MKEQIEIPWLHTYEEIWLRLLNSERTPHAVLITGSRGIGKRSFASWLAGQHLEIDSVKEKPYHPYIIPQHADLRWIQPEDGKRDISVDQIRGLIEILSLSSYEGIGKVAVIEPFNMMNINSSNSLLKILEEPPKDTFFIMSSNFIHQIPATIRSRSIEIEVTVPSFNECHEWLSESYSENIDLGIELSDNRPLVAKYLMDLNILELRSTFIKDISGIIKSGKHIVNISEQWCKELETLPLKLEWMSYILIDAIKHESANEHAEVLSDSENITRYLGENSDIFNLHELLNKTNEIWNLFSGDTNLRKEYQLQSLFVAWEKELGISSL